MGGRYYLKFIGLEIIGNNTVLVISNYRGMRIGQSDFITKCKIHLLFQPFLARFLSRTRLIPVRSIWQNWQLLTQQVKSCQIPSKVDFAYERVLTFCFLLSCSFYFYFSFPFSFCWEFTDFHYSLNFWERLGTRRTRDVLKSFGSPDTNRHVVYFSQPISGMYKL